MADYKIAIITDYHQFLDLKNDWNRFAENLPSIYPFICFEWFDLWFDSFLNDAKLHICVLRDTGGIRAILPLLKSPSPLPFLPISMLKLPVNDHSHKIEVLSDRKAFREYIHQILLQLSQEHSSLLYFEDFLIESDTIDYMIDFMEENRNLFLFGIRRIRQSVVLDLSNGWDSLFRNLPKKFRKNVNNQKNRLTKKYAVEFAKYADPADLPEAFECIRRIGAKSWQGESATALFSKNSTTRFYKQLAEFAASKGWLSVWILYADGSPIAYEYHLNAASTEYALKAEYDRDYSHFSPGAVLDAHIVKELSDGPTDRYDLLGFKEVYKTRWSANTDKYVRIFLFKPNFVGRMWHFFEFPLRTRFKNSICLRNLRDSFLRYKTVGQYKRSFLNDRP